MHSAAFKVSVFPVSLSRALLLDEMVEKPIAHMAVSAIYSTIAEIFLTLECCHLLVFAHWHIYLGFVARFGLLYYVLSLGLIFNRYILNQTSIHTPCLLHDKPLPLPIYPIWRWKMIFKWCCCFGNCFTFFEDWGICDYYFVKWFFLSFFSSTFYALIPVKDFQLSENESHVSPRSLSQVKGAGSEMEIFSSSVIASDI